MQHDVGTLGFDSRAVTQRGKDFIESQAAPGKVSLGGSLNNRHVECTDCHNPHHAVRRRSFLDSNLNGTSPFKTAKRPVDLTVHPSPGPGGL